MARISHAKNTQQSAADLYKQAANKETEALAAVFEDYEKTLRNSNALDFDDLLLEAVRLLRHDDATRHAWNRRLSYMLVDEYQDTNRSQYELMRLLTEDQRNVCVVGDEDQSIYSWRGADIRNILDFERDYPNARVIRLEQNYRSTKNILAAASRVVENNKERKGKKLWTDAAAGDLLGLYAGFDSENEALFVADTIEKHLAANPDDHVAVLYRTNFQSRQLEEALRRYGRSYKVVGGFSFYQRAEIRDVVAYLRLAISSTDSTSLLRIVNTPARGIGRTTVEQIERHARELGLSLWDAIQGVVDDRGLSTRSQSSLVLFRNLMQDISLVASASPLPEVIRFVLERTGYRKMLEQERTPDSEARLENLDELSQRRRRGRVARRIAFRFPGSRRPGGGSRYLRRERAGHSDDAAQRQGTGIPGGVPDRHGIGPFPAQPLDEFRTGARRGAAALLRGNDAGAAQADSDLGQVPPALRRRRTGALHAFLVPERGT